jgi:ribosomal protein L7/L12
MPKCRFCNHNNSAGIDRCLKCGARLEQAVPSASAGQESRTGSEEPVVQQPNDLEGQLLSLLKAGRKIEAIQLYRQETGSGLKEAKDAVEAIATGQPIARRSDESVENIGVDLNGLERQVLALLQGQQTIRAIKLYREQAGVGLKQAKDAVEALAAKYGISPKGAGCAGMVLVMIVVSTMIGIGVWASRG